MPAFHAIEASADVMLVTTLCMIRPFEARQKQALPEAAEPAERAGMPVALMRMARHGMAPDAKPS